MKRPQVWRKQNAESRKNPPVEQPVPKKTYRLSTHGDLDSFVKYFTGFEEDGDD